MGSEEELGCSPHATYSLFVVRSSRDAVRAAEAAKEEALLRAAASAAEAKEADKARRQLERKLEESTVRSFVVCARFEAARRIACVAVLTFQKPLSFF